jgi:hypothetical protein
VTTVWLTTFWGLRFIGAEAYSIAHSQPEGFDLPELNFLKPVGPTGVRLKSTAPDFRKNYDQTLLRNSEAVAEWLDRLNVDTALCCWCRSRPYRLDRCHRILVGILLKRMRPDIYVRLDMKSPAWRT